MQNYVSRQVTHFDSLALIKATRQKQKAVWSFDVSMYDTLASPKEGCQMFGETKPPRPPAKKQKETG